MSHVELQENYQLFINGQWKDASDGAVFTSTCPANGKVLASCAQATKEDVDEAVNAAWAAFESWKKTSVNERAAILNQIADIIDKNAEFLAMVESVDNGKPIRRQWQSISLMQPVISGILPAVLWRKRAARLCWARIHSV